MTVERHLILQSLTLPPSAEWSPRSQGWLVARVAEGTGYWLQHGAEARQLGVGDGLLILHNANGVVRASQLGSLKLQFFTVQPQFLNGLLTVTEWHQLEVAPRDASSPVALFTAGEPLGQKFTRLAEQPYTERLPMRCGLLQLWASAIADRLMPLAPFSNGGNKLRDHFRELIGQMAEAELSACSLSDLSRQLHCSERHFSRLFREEFGVPFRSRQIELRLQRARQLLANSNAKIINVAYDSGYRHLGLFNAMFKKRFGLTPGEWRQQNLRKAPSTQTRNHLTRTAARASARFALLGLTLCLPAFAQTNLPATDTPAMARVRAALFQKMAELDAQEKQAAHPQVVSTNPGPKFDLEKYLITGNSILTPGDIGEILTNLPGAFGTNVTFDGIRAALTDLQMAYRERGFVTVAVGLPQQKLTNATVKVQVTEGRLANIHITGNRYFGDRNVMRALPSLHTNMLLNSHVFQRELDLANASRDRQIYPVIGPGLAPGTSELTLKVTDRLPLHSRVELNNAYTPNTPDLRVAFNAEYDNLWDLEHQIGLQYGFSPTSIEGRHDYWFSPFEDPQIANYSGYYRMPLGGVNSVQEQIKANPEHFGYNEATHQFNLPPATGRPELTFYAGRSVSDTGVLPGPLTLVTNTPLLTIYTQNPGQNVTLNEGTGVRFSVPLPQLQNSSSTFSIGVDFKRYRLTSYNTNDAILQVHRYDSGGHLLPPDQQPPPQNVPQGQPPQYTALDYLPFNVGLNGSLPDKLGTTFFNAQVNFNVLNFLSGDADFAKAIGTTNAVHSHYVTVQAGADRVQTIYHDWSVKLHADGQWANTRLFSNEQYAMGGSAGVRGFLDGEAYGDTGWRISIEPQTPLINVGEVDDNSLLWIRGSAFVDYGEVYLLKGGSFADLASLNGPVLATLPGNPSRLSLWGAGFSLTANIGNHLDARFTVALPLMDPAGRPGFSPWQNLHVYFGVGAQF